MTDSQVLGTIRALFAIQCYLFMRVHAVHQLIQSRKLQATKPFRARGAKIERCDYCQVAKQHCICQYQPQLKPQVAVLLLMSDNEILKPSNTGRLIADVVPETYCFRWSRTEPSPQMLELLADNRYQPVVIFPSEYVEEQSRVLHSVDSQLLAKDKIPLLIFLDGSWREARRIFKKSPYLDELPVLSVQPERISEYLMRKAEKEHHLSTVEVASLVLQMLEETVAASTLELWFELFRESYMLSKSRRKQEFIMPTLERYLNHVQQVVSP